MKTKSAFTIVELLIVIVVIGILAALVISTYSGVQARARDAKRRTDINAITKALEMYHADKGGYPNCQGGNYVPGGSRASNEAKTCLGPYLQTYLNPIPVDPINSGDNQYFYAVGYTKISDSSYSDSQTDNYILGTKLETVTSPTYGGWGHTLTFLQGSAN